MSLGRWWKFRWAFFALWLHVQLGMVHANAVEGESQPVTYVVSLKRAADHMLHVEMQLPAGPDERELQLPVWNALYQVRDFSQYLGPVRAHSDSGVELDVKQVNKSRWRITGARTGVRIDYQVFANSAGPFGAQVNSQHAFLNLAEVLIYAVDSRSRPVELAFTNLAANWRVATSLRGLSANASPLRFHAEDYDRLVDAPVEAGEFQEAEFEEGGGHYRVVVDGNPADYDMQKVVWMDRRVAAAETAWMNDRPFDDYLFIYHVVRGPAGGGMEHAFSTAIDTQAGHLEDDSESLSDVTAHEFFHLWNVKRIRPRSLDPVDYTQENYTDALWFCEGMTSTVSDYARMQAGLLDAPQFLRTIGEQITELQLRGAHQTQSVEDSSFDAWLEKYDFYRSPERSISYYNKGYLLGILLDLEMRETSLGKVTLRDLFRSMNENYARRGRTYADSEGIRLAAEGLCHADLKSFFKKYIAGTEEIPWDDFFRTVGLKLTQNTTRVADTGFMAVQNFNELPVVTAVEDGSEAQKTGLSVGDSVAEINGTPMSQGFERALAALRPGDTLRMQVGNRRGSRDLSWKLGEKERLNFELKDLGTISATQRSRRSAWLKSESQVESRP